MFTPRFISNMDHDRMEVIVSSGIILLIVLIGSLFLPTKLLFAVLPLQFAVTYLLSRRRRVKYKDRVFIDAQSNKAWNDTITNALCQAGSVLTFITGALALSNQDYSKPMSAFWLICPLVLTRTVLFIRKLPLAALYPQGLLKIDRQSARKTGNTEELSKSDCDAA